MSPHANNEATGHPSADGTQRAVEVTQIAPRLFSRGGKRDVGRLQRLCNQQTQKGTYVHASALEKNIPVYHRNRLQKDVLDYDLLKDEWNHALLDGPGVFIIKAMYQDVSVIDAASAAFQQIIKREASSQKGDHFAAGGKNDRIWNSFSKHCLEDPASFVEYYSNPWLAFVCEAWLGPAYRITSQTNIVKPGGAAQVSHRDYHLGFQTEAACSRFPKAVQIASQLLTLQGAVAHTDMPLDSGPTRFLPYSQLLEEGYMAYRSQEVVDFFQEHYVSLPLQKGDAVFFNPGLMHAAGENRTSEFARSANLIQVSSAFGKTMESIDSLPLLEKCWPLLREKFEDKGLSSEVCAFVAAVSEGYPFPTNLDRRPPTTGGMAPISEQDLLVEALEHRVSREDLMRMLRQMRADSQA